LVIETSLYSDAPSEKHQTIQIPNFMKIRPVETELFHAGGRRVRDMTKLLAILQTHLGSTLLIHYDWLLR